LDTIEDQDETDQRMNPLLTDLYEITMASGYFHHRMHQTPAVFQLYFRNPPFGSSYAIAAGLETAIDFITHFRIGKDELEYLRSFRGIDHEPMLNSAFLESIVDLRLKVDVDAIPEGTIVFADQPLVRVTGPLWQCQWIETALLCVINFQTLIATKASRVRVACGDDDQVLEFGLRRAQGVDGGMSASRAAYIGGVNATSNVAAGHRFGIPVRGTHAHSWVMAFEDEPTAFSAYAEAMPGNVVLLVDTYNTIQGIRNAIDVGLELRRRGSRLIGVRLDSGDLAELSIQARKMLDQAGLTDASIVASNDLDEHKIADLKRRGCKVDTWGVGTNLVTAADQPALGGVYKLVAIGMPDGTWSPRIKLSENVSKSSIPGRQQVRRFFKDGTMVGDAIYDIDEAAGKKPSTIVDRHGRELTAVVTDEWQDLLIPVLRNGRLAGSMPALNEIRDRAFAQRQRLNVSCLRNDAPESYPAGIESSLKERIIQMMNIGK
jgi:nicotinate phosphoribosyltransferase